MASHVVVLLSNGQRQNVKTTPMMSLKQILQAVCDKQHYDDPEKYGLKHNRTILDLSLSVRFANLPQGAKLELIRVAASKTQSEVTIALQLDDGNRMIHKFSTSTPLWNILLHFERTSDGQINLIKRTANAPVTKKGPWKKFSKKDNTPYYQQPVCLLLNKEYATTSILKSTTLQSAGITSGNVALRVLFRHTDLTLEEALQLEEMKQSSGSSDRNDDNESKVVDPEVSTISAPEDLSQTIIDSKKSKVENPSAISQQVKHMEVDPVEPEDLSQTIIDSKKSKGEMLSAVSQQVEHMEVDPVEPEPNPMLFETRQETKLKTLDTNKDQEGIEKPIPQSTCNSQGTELIPEAPTKPAPGAQAEPVQNSEMQTEPIPQGQNSLSTENNLEHFPRDVKVFNPPSGDIQMPVQCKSTKPVPEDPVQGTQVEPNSEMQTEPIPQGQNSLSTENNIEHFPRDVKVFNPPSGDTQMPECKSTKPAPEEPVQGTRVGPNSEMQTEPIPQGQNSLSAENNLEHFSRDIKVFNPPPGDIQMPAQFDLPDSFYELTPAELKYLLETQKSKRIREENTAFKTSAFRAQEEKAREKRYPKTLVRVKFPDRTQLQAAFISKEQVAELYKFVRESLQNSERPFYLYISPPKKVIEDQSISFYAANLAPATLVHFNWVDGPDTGPYLAEHILALAEKIPTPAGYINSTIDAEMPTSTTEDTSIPLVVGRNKNVDRKAEKNQSESNITGKMPKWFKAMTNTKKK